MAGLGSTEMGCRREGRPTRAKATFAIINNRLETGAIKMPEAIERAIARDAEQPARDMVNRHQQTVCFHELVEDILQDVLGVSRIRHAASDEAPQPGLLARDDLGDPLVLFECHPPVVIDERAGVDIVGTLALPLGERDVEEVLVRVSASGSGPKWVLPSHRRALPRFARRRCHPCRPL